MDTQSPADRVAPVVIDLAHVRVSHGRTLALDGVDLHVRRGEIVGLVGPEGSGKTTLLRTLLDQRSTSGGTVRVLGFDPANTGPALRSRIGYAPAQVRLPRRWTVADALTHLAALSRLPSGHIRATQDGTHPSEPLPAVASWEEWAQQIELNPTARVGRLSAGDLRKLALVQAFMHRPEVLLLDEPAADLDPFTHQLFHRWVRDARDSGAAVVLCSRALTDIEHLADRLVVLRHGTVAWESRVHDLRRRVGRIVTLTAAELTLREATQALQGIPGIADTVFTEGTNGVTIRLICGSNVNGLLRAIAAWNVVDIAISRPELEQVVAELGSSDAPAPFLTVLDESSEGIPIVPPVDWEAHFASAGHPVVEPEEPASLPVVVAETAPELHISTDENRHEHAMHARRVPDVSASPHPASPHPVIGSHLPSNDLNHPEHLNHLESPNPTDTGPLPRTASDIVAAGRDRIAAARRQGEMHAEQSARHQGTVNDRVRPRRPSPAHETRPQDERAVTTGGQS